VRPSSSASFSNLSLSPGNNLTPIALSTFAIVTAVFFFAMLDLYPTNVYIVNKINEGFPSMAMQLRELTQNWVNPHFDRRKKYGMEATELLKAGTRIVCSSYDMVFVVGSKFWTTGKLAEDLINLSVPVEPASWDEFRVSAGDDVSFNNHTNAVVLELLWQKPELRAALAEALTAAMQEDTA